VGAGGTLLTARGADHRHFSGALDLLTPEISEQRAPVEIRIFSILHLMVMPERYAGKIVRAFNVTFGSTPTAPTNTVE